MMDGSSGAGGETQPTGKAAPGSRARRIDLAEKIILIALFLFFVHNQLEPAFSEQRFVSYLLILGEATVLVFVLFRRATDAISDRPMDWACGFMGTCLPLFAMPGGNGSLIPVWICGMIMLTGFIVQMSAKLTLRRSFGVVAANRGVKVSGPYLVVRHPMYAGYLMTHVGFLLASPTFFNLAVYATALAFQIYRIEAEERLLGEDPAYQTFAARTRYRLVPGIY
ncbi:MAG: methyltransferase family protein [Labrys sp. (in: a-proteobacteria)]